MVWMKAHLAGFHLEQIALAGVLHLCFTHPLVEADVRLLAALVATGADFVR
jgi:hypothetical protein